MLSSPGEAHNWRSFQSVHFLFHPRYDGVAYTTTSRSAYQARAGENSGKNQSVEGGPSSHKMNYV